MKLLILISLFCFQCTAVFHHAKMDIGNVDSHTAAFFAEDPMNDILADQSLAIDNPPLLDQSIFTVHGGIIQAKHRKSPCDEVCNRSQRELDSCCFAHGHKYGGYCENGNQAYCN
uniref:Uncharacterized protein n=1 Tax=Panagrolaimus superbus TaxID=310955 RepID=A0A914XYW1_9BILA